MINYHHTAEIHNTKAAHEVLPFIFNLLNPQSVVDIGCGTGTWLKVSKQLGAKKISGVDGLRVADDVLQISPAEFLQHDLTLPLTLEKFDLAICMEVVEHLPDSAAENIINILTNVSDMILFSAAIPEQGGQNHINEQCPRYWQDIFFKKSFYPIDVLRSKFWCNANVDWWYRQNMLLYATKEIADKLNLEVIPEIPVYIHPELFNIKLQEIHFARESLYDKEAFIENEITNPSFIKALKRLIKSVIRF